MTIGERRIRGIIREREEAEQIYQEAKRAGLRRLAAHRRSGPTSSPSRSPTSSRASRSTSTSSTSTRWPTTTAGTSSSSRWSSARASTRRARPTASARSARGQTGASGQSDRSPVSQARRTQRPRHLAEGRDRRRRGHRGIRVPAPPRRSTRSAVARERPTCRAQPARQPARTRTSSCATASPASGSRSSLLTHRDERGGFFTLMLYPPEELSSLRRAAAGDGLRARLLGQHDRPSDRAGQGRRPSARLRPARAGRHVPAHPLLDQRLAARPRAARRHARERPARAAVPELAAGRGRHDDDRGHQGRARLPARPAAAALRLLPDRRLHRQRNARSSARSTSGSAPSRIFSFGVGSSVNRYLLDRMAKLGPGRGRLSRPERQRGASHGPTSSSASAIRRSPTSRSTGAACRSRDVFPDTRAGPVRRPPGDSDRPFDGHRTRRRSASAARSASKPMQIAVPVDPDDAARHAQRPAPASGPG